MNTEMGDASQRLGWGSGWTAAINRMRYLLTIELNAVDDKLKIRREKLEEYQTAVYYLEDHRKSLVSMAENLDILLPGEWGKAE